MFTEKQRHTFECSGEINTQLTIKPARFNLKDSTRAYFKIIENR